MLVRLHLLVTCLRIKTKHYEYTTPISKSAFLNWQKLIPEEDPIYSATVISKDFCNLLSRVATMTDQKTKFNSSRFEWMQKKLAIFH